MNRRSSLFAPGPGSFSIWPFVPVLSTAVVLGALLFAPTVATL